MRHGDLLTQIKDSSTDEGNFTIVIGVGSDYEKQQIISSAEWLQSEMYIRLKTCEVQKAMETEGVVLSGKLLNL